MSSSVDQIIDNAESLAKPKNPFLAAYNAFATSRYKKAIRLLEDEPVEFSPDEPLRLIIRGREERGDAEKLLGHIGDYAPFSLTFTELISEFNRRADRSLVAVDLLETSWEEITGALEALEKLDAELENAELETSTAAKSDGLFALPALHEILVPAVEEGKIGAAQVGRKDPVEAFRTWIPATRSQAEEGLSLCETVRRARAEIFPKLEAASDALRKLGRLPHWIDDTLTSLSDHANALAAKAAEESIFEEAKTFAGDVAHLAENAEAAVDLAKRADGPATSAIAESRKSVAATRKQLARKLGIPVGALLSEDADVDPSRRLDEAETQVVAAQAAIDRGGVLAAGASLDEADRLVVESSELTRITKEAFAAHPDRLIEQRHENEQLESLCTERTKILNELKSNYAPSALRFEVGHEDAGESIAGYDGHAADAIAEASHAMKRSEKAHASGRILEGAAELERAANQHAAAQELLDEIRDHAGRIATAEKQNRRDLDSLKTRIDSARPTMDDPKIMVRTRKSFIDAIDTLDRAAESVGAPHGQSDPFIAAKQLTQAKTKLDEVDASVSDDRRSHAEATHSLTAAAAQLDDCRRLVRESETDRIPDSRAITEAGDAVKQLVSRYRNRRPPDRCPPRRLAGGSGRRRSDSDPPLHAPPLSSVPNSIAPRPPWPPSNAPPNPSNPPPAGAAPTASAFPDSPESIPSTAPANSSASATTAKPSISQVRPPARPTPPSPTRKPRSPPSNAKNGGSLKKPAAAAKASAVPFLPVSEAHPAAEAAARAVSAAAEAVPAAADPAPPEAPEPPARAGDQT